MAGPAKIALNLPYGALSAEDKERFRQSYENLPAGDEPPFPIGGLADVLAPIAKAQQILQAEGNLMLIVSVDSTGLATQVQVFGGVKPEMRKFASQVVMLTKYKPAVCRGVPCQMEFPVSIKFTVE